MLSLVVVGITALKKKGLRRTSQSAMDWATRWNHRPEEEGITTSAPSVVRSLTRWNHRPEEEGITTSIMVAINKDPVGITALKKKGLRPEKRTPIDT